MGKKHINSVNVFWKKLHQPPLRPLSFTKCFHSRSIGLLPEPFPISHTIFESQQNSVEHFTSPLNGTYVHVVLTSVERWSVTHLAVMNTNTSSRNEKHLVRLQRFSRNVLVSCFLGSISLELGSLQHLSVTKFLLRSIWSCRVEHTSSRNW